MLGRLLAMILVLAAAAPSSFSADLKRDLNAYLAQRGAKEHVSALSLTVSLSPSQPDVNVTAGTTTYGGSTPITPASLFQIGSNTKAFTAVAVLQLEAQGRLSIDAPIGNYLPQYPAYRHLTLRRLLNMTSGLESYDNTPQWERNYGAHPDATVSADSLIRLVYPQIRYAPGTTYHYSNTGYLLAQEIVAARSKSRSFEKEMDDVIASAGLKNTYYTSTVYPPAIASRVVAGYYENNEPGLRSLIGKDVSGASLSWAQGAGSIVSTPHDLAKWVRELYQGTRLLPAKQKRELLGLVSIKTAKPITAATPTDAAGFGLGVAQRYNPKLGTFWFYQGETLGFRAAHLYFPKSGMVVAVFANSRPVEEESHLQQLFGQIDDTIQAHITR
ncbi:MAG TPA: serine hydrolase domain-containing protein [Candidatus Baltobacteraceae bacterium]|nr:serine hydrolase domain-containing protein [Candidatus Baltobacteraceae bacterium]